MADFTTTNTAPADGVVAPPVAASVPGIPAAAPAPVVPGTPGSGDRQSLFDQVFSRATGEGTLFGKAPEPVAPAATPASPAPAPTSAETASVTAAPATNAPESPAQEEDKIDVDAALQQAFGGKGVKGEGKDDKQVQPGQQPAASTAPADGKADATTTPVPSGDEEPDTSSLAPDVKTYLESPQAKRVHQNHRAFREVQKTLKSDFGIDLQPEHLINYARDGKVKTELEAGFMGHKGPEGVDQWVQYHFTPNPDGSLPPGAPVVVERLGDELFKNPVYVEAILKSPVALDTMVGRVSQVLPNVLVSRYAEKFGTGDAAQNQRVQDALTMLGVLLEVDVNASIPGTVASAAPVAVPGTVAPVPAAGQTTGQVNPEVARLQAELNATRAHLQKITGTQQQRQTEAANRQTFTTYVGSHMEAAQAAFDKAIGVPDATNPAAQHIYKSLRDGFISQLVGTIQANPQAHQAIAEIRRVGAGLNNNPSHAKYLSSVVQQAVMDTTRHLLTTTGQQIRRAVFGVVPSAKPTTPLTTSGVPANNGSTAQTQAHSPVVPANGNGTLPAPDKVSPVDKAMAKFKTDLEQEFARRTSTP